MKKTNFLLRKAIIVIFISYENLILGNSIYIYKSADKFLIMLCIMEKHSKNV